MPPVSRRLLDHWDMLATPVPSQAGKTLVWNGAAPLRAVWRMPSPAASLLVPAFPGEVRRWVTHATAQMTPHHQMIATVTPLHVAHLDARAPAIGEEPAGTRGGVIPEWSPLPLPLSTVTVPHQLMNTLDGVIRHRWVKPRNSQERKIYVDL